MTRSSSHGDNFYVYSFDPCVIKPMPLSGVSKLIPVFRRSSFYNLLVQDDKEPKSSRLPRSRTAPSLLTVEKKHVPKRISSLRFKNPLKTPLKEHIKGEVDPWPFPLSPSETAIPQYPLHRSTFVRKRFSPQATYTSPPAGSDRFLPTRRSKDSLSKCYRLSKPPIQLSHCERLIRHHCMSEDPFGRRNRQRAQLYSRHPVPLVNTRPVRQTSFGIFPSPRAASTGAIWNVGGVLPPSELEPVAAVFNSRGGVFGSGTNAPMFTSDFLNPDSTKQSNERFEGRLAAALGIDQASRILNFSCLPQLHVKVIFREFRLSPWVYDRTIWKDSRWIQSSDICPILDAPLLRDDFYCSVLAYCATSKTLAVGLRNRVYLWSEASGVTYPLISENDRRNTYVSSLSFSSHSGRNSILAIGRNSGEVTLWSLCDEEDRCEWEQEHAIACVAFKPVTTKRVSTYTGYNIDAEDLIVGDEVGTLYYYSIEWGKSDTQIRGSDCVMLLAKIDIHTQQVCGIAWDHEGQHFATGGNDNVCLLFSVRDIFPQNTATSIYSKERLAGHLSSPITGMIPDFMPNAASHHTLGSMLHIPSHNSTPIRGSLRLSHDGYSRHETRYPIHVRSGQEMHKWAHSAAVKAIAFCPWQRGLIATGGGSNDRAIHFFHAWSGACLATINVQAQVTSLIWSSTRREIAATFGYAQPEHQYRIAVFSWPGCQQIVAIPWAGDLRALYAIAYPGGPNERGWDSTRSGEGGRWWSRTAEEGCIVVASSDESVKFHEVWSGGKKATWSCVGGLGGSDILESLEGIDKDGDVIR